MVGRPGRARRGADSTGCRARRSEPHLDGTARAGGADLRRKHASSPQQKDKVTRTEVLVRRSVCLSSKIVVRRRSPASSKNSVAAQPRVARPPRTAMLAAALVAAACAGAAPSKPTAPGVRMPMLGPGTGPPPSAEGDHRGSGIRCSGSGGAVAHKRRRAAGDRAAGGRAQPRILRARGCCTESPGRASEEYTIYLRLFCFVSLLPLSCDAKDDATRSDVDCNFCPAHPRRASS